jgi:hypothetical protein
MGAWVAIQVKRAGVWRTATRTTISASGGRYRTTLPGPGVYRVLYAGIAGPAVAAR